MLRFQTLRFASVQIPVVSHAAHFARVSTRRYATETESRRPDGHTLPYMALGLATLCGAYFYFSRNPNNEEKLKKARADEENMKHKIRESAAAVKYKAGSTVEEGKQRYEDAKDATQERFDEIYLDLDDKARQAKARGRGIVDNAEAKYDSAKQSTEQLYDEARDTTERKAKDVRGDLEKIGEDAKGSWFSLKSWGKSKTNESEDKLKHGEAELGKKVAEGAEEVRRGAEKHV